MKRSRCSRPPCASSSTARLRQRPGSRTSAPSSSGDAWRGFAELGLTGLGVDVKYGGSGPAGYRQVSIAAEEVARGDASASVSWLAHLALGVASIDRFGSDEQKERILPPLVDGRGVAAFGLTEPGGGSDAAALQTTAVERGRHLLPQRQQDVHHQRLGGPGHRGLCHAGPQHGLQGRQRFHRREGLARADHQPDAWQAGDAQLHHRRDRVPGHAGVQREPAGRRGARIQPGHGDSHLQPHHHCRPEHRHRPVGAGGRLAVCSAAPVLWPAHRPAPRPSSSCWPTWPRRSTPLAW